MYVQVTLAGKMVVLDKLLLRLQNEGRRVLVFSQVGLDTHVRAHTLPLLCLSPV